MLGGQDARHVRPMAVVVHRIRVVIHEVVAALVVAEQLRVDDRRLGGGRLVVDVVNARIDDGDLDAGAGDARLEGGLATDPVDAPGVVVLEVARRERQVGVNLRNQRVVPQSGDRIGRDGCGDALDQVEGALHLTAGLLDRGPGCRAGAIPEQHDHLGRPGARVRAGEGRLASSRLAAKHVGGQERQDQCGRGGSGRQAARHA